jgi:hypothetical protein
MIPPTSIDGTDITGATIDGTDVTEITVDGDVVFSAGPGLPPTNQLQYWFSASQETSSNNTSIGTLTDFSGNSRDASFTAGNQAVFKTSGGKMNGAAYYEMVSSGYETSYIPGSMSGFSLFAVYNNSANPPADNDAEQFDFGSGAGHFPFSDNTYYIATGSSSRWISNVSGLNSTNVYLLHIYGDGSSLVAEQYDGTTSNTLGTQSSSSYSFSNNVKIGYLGFSRKMDGELYEVLFYDKYLTSAEETQVGNFLNGLYGLNF